MGNWFSSESTESTENTLACGSGTKRVNDECVYDAEYLESFENFAAEMFATGAPSKEECDNF